MNKNKNHVPIIQHIEQHLSGMNDYRYNVVTGYIEFKCKECMSGQILDEYDFNTLLRSLAKSNLSTSSSMLKNLLKSSFVPKFNPFDSYFNKLSPWDQETDFIGQLADTVKTTNDELWRLFLKKWLVAMVACLLDDNVSNHTMLVLSGEQGIGKTTWTLKLIPPELRDYVFSGSIDPNNKDTYIFLAEKILINLDELEILNRNQLGSLKQLITKDSVKIRRPYATLSETMPRRASFASSVNFKEFLSDLSGNRRFLCFEAIDINYKHNVSMEGVYTQAMALWKSGFKFWFDKTEIDVINANNEQYRTKSLEEELLLKHFDPCIAAEANDFLTTTEILNVIFGDDRRNIHNGSLQRLGKILSSRGFLRLKRAGRQVYCVKRKGFISQAYQAV